MRIELRDVGMRYPEGAALFENVSVSIDAGQFVLIEGPSGSGKSSLLRLINRLQEPSSGQLLADGKPLTQLETPTFRRQVAFLQQTPTMLPGSVLDNLLFPFGFTAARGTTAPSREALQAELQHFQLDVGFDDDAAKLSQGQKQRLALIRALHLEPQVLLCDEPTSALDPESRDIVQAELENQSCNRQRTVIVVTHVDFQPTCPVRRFRLTRSEGLQEVTA